MYCFFDVLVFVMNFFCDEVRTFTANDGGTALIGFSGRETSLRSGRYCGTYLWTNRE